MRRIVTPAFIIAPLVLITAACNAPSEAPDDTSVDDSMSSADYSADQPVVEDPMAGDVVVEDGGAMSSVESDAEQAGGSATTGDADTSAKDDSAMTDEAEKNE